MDFTGIIKGAWRVTWRYKTLWVLGLFAGTVGGGYSSWSTSSYRTSSRHLSRFRSPAVAWAEFTSFVHDWAPALIAAAVALVLIGLLWLVLSLAAQAGLVWEVDVAERGGIVSASEGWNVGFHHWWKVLGVGLVLMLPIVLLGLLVLALAAAILLPLIGSFPSAGSSAGPAVGGIRRGWSPSASCRFRYSSCFAFVLGNMYRARDSLPRDRGPYADERDSGFVAAATPQIQGRVPDVADHLRARTIGFGIAIAIPAGVDSCGYRDDRAVLGHGRSRSLLGILLFVVMIVVMAAWNTFTSALWTIFFRRLDGSGCSAAQGLGAALSGIPGRALARVPAAWICTDWPDRGPAQPPPSPPDAPPVPPYCRTLQLAKRSITRVRGAVAAMPGRLLVCATPIGNLGDVTLRVLEALREADIIVAEDTRVTRRLLPRYEIVTPLERYDEHVAEETDSGDCSRACEAGRTIALVSDAGTPGRLRPGRATRRGVHRGRRCCRGTTRPERHPRRTCGERTADARVLLRRLSTATRRKSGRPCSPRLAGLDATLIFYESPRTGRKALESIARRVPGANGGTRAGTHQDTRGSDSRSDSRGGGGDRGSARN